MSIFPNNRNITKFWTNFHLCNIIQPERKQKRTQITTRERCPIITNKQNINGAVGREMNGKFHGIWE
jgi:hypothetical protein